VHEPTFFGQGCEELDHHTERIAGLDTLASYALDSERR
jgi:hypothetical protein